MANVDRPRGFSPIGTLSGSPWSASVQAFELDTGHNAIAVGDLVQMTTAGTLELFAAGQVMCVGVCVGVLPQGAGWNATTGKFGDNALSATEPTLVGVNSRSVPLNTAGTILVATAPDLLMVGQEDGDTDPLNLADVGMNVEIIGGGPDAATGQSDMLIDSDTAAATATLPLRLIGIYNSPENEFGDVDATRPTADWMVTFANHAYKGQVLGAA